jgi:flagellar basal body-associated protein FliL
MAEAEPKTNGKRGGMLIPALLVLVLLGLVVVIMLLRGVMAKTGAPPPEADQAEAAPVKMFQIPVCEGKTTTNRLQQAVQCTVTLQVREDAKGEREAKWNEAENLNVLNSVLVDVIQSIDFQSPRPPAKDQFEAEVRRRVDALMGEEGAVDRVLVTQWVVMGR